MEPRDYDSFAEVIAGFAELKGKQLSAPAIELYWRAMKHWRIEDFRAAAEHLLRRCEFMPVPKDFEDLRRASEPTAAEAWATALQNCGCWRTGGAPNGRIARAAETVGGFRAIAMAHTERDLPHIQRRFMQAYDELTDVEETRQAVPEVTWRNGKALPLADIAKQLT